LQSKCKISSVIPVQCWGCPSNTCMLPRIIRSRAKFVNYCKRQTHNMHWSSKTSVTEVKKVSAWNS
jgi:hypothetical protein